LASATTALKPNSIPGHGNLRTSSSHILSKLACAVARDVLWASARGFDGTSHSATILTKLGLRMLIVYRFRPLVFSTDGDMGARSICSYGCEFLTVMYAKFARFREALLKPTLTSFG
jgi:hypothetical protein